ncbi:hypothetical protein FGO68_gene124 [Halteria grandinella]|uniref:Uncharacterized protein n=1 Tax=Halteria grandinella TaxID=5974 RepID=A0A8J8NA51_HALGN|nr:hypothetical protein FGO68_gene124 [Halteria grandinella]
MISTRVHGTNFSFVTCATCMCTVLCTQMNEYRRAGIMGSVWKRCESDSWAAAQITPKMRQREIICCANSLFLRGSPKARYSGGMSVLLW